jgi:tripartite ATP-independent transporter DctM subunit
VTIGLIGVVVLFILLAIELPVGYAMLCVGFVGFWILVSQNAALIKLATSPFSTIASYNLAVIPLFIIMAQVITATGFVKSLYNIAYKWLGHLRGGLSIATVAACGVFAAVSASSMATALTMGLVALPEMKRFKYDDALATGCVAAGGTLGVLIPPSGILIIYGLITSQSISKLFMAGIIPGLIQALFYMITVYILCKRNPNLGPPGPRTNFKERIIAIGQGGGETMALIALILGGLFAGWFTPTEAGAVGAFGAIMFGLARRRLHWQNFKKALFGSALNIGMLIFILIGGTIFGFFLTASTLPAALAAFVAGLDLPPLLIMALIMVLYVFLGCFLDAMSMILLTIPIFLPLAVKVGFDPIWFGIVLVKAVEMAVITPPVGMNVFSIHSVAKGVPMETIFKGIVPFLIADIFEVALLLFFPQIVMFLPNLMK